MYFAGLAVLLLFMTSINIWKEWKKMEYVGWE